MWCKLLSFGLILSTLALANKSKELKHPIHSKQLQFVQAVWRHGDRAPSDLPYPNDKYDEEYWPRGWNQLTNEGMRQLKDLGQFMRQRYVGSFINHTYNVKEVSLKVKFLIF
jgi:prostatic aicd phosphatase